MKYVFEAIELIFAKSALINRMPKNLARFALNPILNLISKIGSDYFIAKVNAEETISGLVFLFRLSFAGSAEGVWSMAQNFNFLPFVVPFELRSRYALRILQKKFCKRT